jgi:hypothetical protein
VPLLDPFAPGQRTLVVDKVIADGRPLIAKCFSAQTQTLRLARIRRYVDRAQPFDIPAGTCGKYEVVGSRLRQQDSGGEKIPAGKRGFANLLEQLVG